MLVSLVLSFMVCVSSGFTGYSYAKFRGPVSGPEREVNVVHDDGKYHYHNHHHHKGAHDYVAKPDYHFAYGVEDPKSMVKQSRHETRYGDDVKGEYRLVQQGDHISNECEFIPNEWMNSHEQSQV